MRSTAGLTPLPRPAARPEASLVRVITELGRRPAWRPPVRLVGWLELLRRTPPAFA